MNGTWNTGSCGKQLPNYHKKVMKMLRAINWWYLPVALVKLAGLIAGVALIAVCASWPLWVCAGIVGLI